MVLHEAELNAQVKRAGRLGGPAQQGEQLPPQGLLDNSSRREIRPRDGLDRQCLRPGRASVGLGEAG